MGRIGGKMDEAERERLEEADGRARWDMFRDVWKAMYDEEPPAMPLSGSEAWNLLMARIAKARERFLENGDPFPRLYHEIRRWR